MQRTVTPCRILVYTLSQDDAVAINRRRTTGKSIAERIQLKIAAWMDGKTNAEDQHFVTGWPLGAQAHIGSEVLAGMEFPAIAVRVVDGPATQTGGDATQLVNMQVMLDGNDTFWATQRIEGKEPGTWRWPI